MAEKIHRIRNTKPNIHFFGEDVRWGPGEVVEVPESILKKYDNPAAEALFKNGTLVTVKDDEPATAFPLGRGPAPAPKPGDKVPETDLSKLIK